VRNAEASVRRGTGASGRPNVEPPEQKRADHEYKGGIHTLDRGTLEKEKRHARSEISGCLQRGDWTRRITRVGKEARNSNKKTRLSRSSSKRNTSKGKGVAYKKGGSSVQNESRKAERQHALQRRPSDLIRGKKETYRGGKKKKRIGRETEERKGGTSAASPPRVLGALRITRTYAQAFKKREKT